jgi:uncharacterized membrane protein YphA (DoxX/SURF4 family)
MSNYADKSVLHHSDWIETLIRIILGVVFFAHGAAVIIVRGSGAVSLDRLLFNSIN